MQVNDNPGNLDRDLALANNAETEEKLNADLVRHKDIAQEVYDESVAVGQPGSRASGIPAIWTKSRPCACRTMPTVFPARC